MMATLQRVLVAVGRRPIGVVALWLMLAATTMAQEPPLIKQLDAPTRGKVVLALAGLLIMGLAMLLLVWLGFRFLRRRQREFQHDVYQRRLRPHDPDDWARSVNVVENVLEQEEIDRQG